MSKYKYTDKEKGLNKILKMNQDESYSLDKKYSSEIRKLDSIITSSEELLQSLGYSLPEKISTSEKINLSSEIKTLPSYESLLKEANEKISEEVEFEDLLCGKEFKEAYKNLDAIHAEFSAKTSIMNATDLAFLGIATALQTVKALLFGNISGRFGYSECFDPAKRLAHNDTSIKVEHRKANDEFKAKYEKYGSGYWMNILYQSPPYDITKGSKAIGKNMEGGYHRFHTLGHDPVLGWIFGTANILTDTITFEDFQTNRVLRNPMFITPERISLVELFKESYEVAKSHILNLPAAIFAEGCHLKSDAFTKLGLPVPILEIVNIKFANTSPSKLYKSHYDALCFSRDLKTVGVSAGISIFINMIIILVHSLFNRDKADKDLYEVRTRKILIISNSIASSSNLIQTLITRNPKNMDIGGLLITVSRLFSDLSFMARIEEEYINQKLNNELIRELKRMDDL